MKCPVCAQRLARVAYEEFRVSHCPHCRGYLLTVERLAAIKRKGMRSLDDLKREAMEEMGDDTLDRIRCPECRHKMDKKLLPPPAEFHIDRCQDCSLIWFDGGELALYQLHYQASPQGREAEELRRRHAEMSPQRRLEFEERLANMPRADSPFEGLLENFD